MSETIIIEANREIAYKEEVEALKTARTDENVPNFPNNEWKTQIQTGIPLEVGDQVSVEATMIQQKGTPEETIEFSGTNNIKNPWGLVDNKANLKFSFYMTNRQQFNCPLPLFDCTIKNAEVDASILNYGLTNVSTFAKIRQAYSYRGIEGMYKDGTTYKEVDGGGVFSRPPNPIDDSSPIRFYLYNVDGNFKSFQTADGDTSDLNQALSQFDINIDEGFNTPENIAQTITEQFHEREGVPDQDGWNNSFAYPQVFSLDGNNIRTQAITGITDRLYKTINTSTGDLLVGRLQGQWATKFAGESGSEGDNYTEQQGLNFLYRNILIGNPEEFESARYIMSMRKGNFNATNVPALIDEAGTYTGDQNIVNGIGQWGANLVILDVLDSDASTITWNYATSKTASASVDNIATLKMK